MRNPLLLLAMASLLASCMGEMEVSGCKCQGPLLESSFEYDNLANAGFSPKAPVWNGDTLVVWDLWAVSDQPDFRAHAARRQDTLKVSYVPVSEASNDWSPPVETRLKFLLPRGLSQVTLHFEALSKAREARHESEVKAGVEDARVDRWRTLVRP